MTSSGTHQHELPEDVVALTAALVAVPSPSHHESAVARMVEAALSACPHLVVERVGDNVVARTLLGRPRRLLLAGHLDTVPPALGNDVPTVAGDVVAGVGAADMKGGVAVLLALARACREPAVDLTFCFYACEEVARVHSGLGMLFRERPELLRADAAVLGEPTGGVVEAGCQGTLRVRIGLVGARAHTARPATGRNAVHRLAPVLTAIEAYRGRRVVLDGCTYVEQLQAVAVDGGVAGNVVPDRATVTVNHRFAPDRTVEEAEAALRQLVDAQLEPGDEWVVEDAAPGALPHLDDPLLARLVAITGRPPRAKVGWTDVATFAEHGVPATNFGPGDPELAHTAGEHVGRADLDGALAVLTTLVDEGP